MVPAVSCRGTHDIKCCDNRPGFVLLLICSSYMFLALTRWALWRDRPPVKSRAVPGNGPDLAGSPDGDGLEGLVGPDVEPRRSLGVQR